MEICPIVRTSRCSNHRNALVRSAVMSGSVTPFQNARRDQRSEQWSGTICHCQSWAASLDPFPGAIMACLSHNKVNNGTLSALRFGKQIQEVSALLACVWIYPSSRATSLLWIFQTGRLNYYTGTPNVSSRGLQFTGWTRGTRWRKHPQAAANWIQQMCAPGPLSFSCMLAWTQTMGVSQCGCVSAWVI